MNRISKPIEIGILCCLFVLVILFYDLLQKESKILKALNVKQNSCFDGKNSLEDVANSNCSLDSIFDDDDSLIAFIKENKLKIPPSKSSKLKLDGRAQNGQIGQVGHVVQYFKNKNRELNGFFIEAGAFDGEMISNTLFLETKLGWTGLLIEPNPMNYKILASRNRQVYSINSCISTSSHPSVVDFFFTGPGSHILKENENSSTTDGINTKVECYPLISILLAVGKTKIDFLSLDVEGSEEKILKAIPWDKIDIDFVTIEVAVSDPKEITRIMNIAGYKVYKELPARARNGTLIMQDIMYEKII